MKLKLLSLFTFFIFLLFNCTDSKKTDPASTTKTLSKEEVVKSQIFSDLYNPNIIESQTFVLGKNDTIIKSKHGSIIKIYANSFQSKDTSKVITEPIKIEIKEVFNKSDMILGNLTTQFGNSVLESGGMIYINATSDGQELELSKGKEIGISVPTNKMKPDMKIFQGIPSDSSITWIDPEPVLNKQVEKLEKKKWKADYQYYKYDKPITQQDRNAIWKVIKDDKTEPGDRVMVNNYILQIYNISKTKIKFSQEDGVFIQDVLTDKGVNNMINDMNTNYIFSVKNLGWVNIDRIYKDPNAEKIELFINVNNLNEFDYIYTTLIFDNREIYIPGYQKKIIAFHLPEMIMIILFLRLVRK